MSNHGIIPAYETISDRSRGDIVDSSDVRVGDRYICEELGDSSYRVVRIDRPVTLPENERWTAGVYAINYEPGYYPDIVMPDTDGWDLISADGTVYNPSEGDIVTLLAPTGEAVAGVDGFAPTATKPVHQRTDNASATLTAALSHLDANRTEDALLMRCLAALVADHTRELGDSNERAEYAAAVTFTGEGADALKGAANIDITRSGLHQYTVGRGTGSGPASTWVSAFAYGLSYVGHVGD